MIAPILRRHLLATSLWAFAASVCGLATPALAADEIVVGSKIDTEGSLLGNMIILALEAQGVKTQSRLQLGPTKIVRQALLSGDIDVYPEYTGNAGFFFGVDADPVWKDAKAGYEKAKTLDGQANKIVWLSPAPANNTWAIAVRGDVADANKLVTMDDMARWVKSGAKVKLAASAEFVESPAALPAFQQAYGFKLTSDQVLVLSGGDTAATIKAAADGTSGVNAGMAYGTDGQLAALNMRVLSDTKNAQPVYAPAPIVRQAALDRSPRIRDILDPLFRGLDLPTLQKLNARIAIEGQDAKAVARDYLAQQGVLKK